ncbi:MAG: GNAT family N-acetyltransferase [Deltaproteobacteria bacterium]|nr:MAG: GNAT family N-acetyltransferase [Deltaproteobacteria bacterium]
MRQAISQNKFVEQVYGNIQSSPGNELDGNDVRWRRKKGFTCGKNEETTLHYLQFRTAEQDDTEAMYAICKLALRDHVERTFGPWNEEQQRGMFYRSTQANTHTLVLQNKELIGYYWWVREESHFRLQRITLRPDKQGQGIGTTLLRMLMEEARDARCPMRLRVFHTNPARRWYKRMGFQEMEQTEYHTEMAWNP